MWYFANPCTQKVREAMRDHRNHLGMIVTPAQGNVLEDEFVSMVDNGVFGDNYEGDDEYIAMLNGRVAGRGKCLFAVAPDEVGDARATLARSAPMFGRISGTGIKPALAAQDGLEHLVVPWDEFGCLFIGGSTNWKLGPQARALVAEARQRDKWVHMGRVNSLRRLRYADHIGCNSADGTYLAFGPDINLPKLLGWLRSVNDQPGLWEVSA